MSLLCELAAMLLLSGAEPLETFHADQLLALAHLLLDVYRNGFMCLWLLVKGVKEPKPALVEAN